MYSLFSNRAKHGAAGDDINSDNIVVTDGINHIYNDAVYSVEMFRAKNGQKMDNFAGYNIYNQCSRAMPIYALFAKKLDQLIKCLGRSYAPGKSATFAKLSDSIVYVNNIFAAYGLDTHMFNEMQADANIDEVEEFLIAEEVLLCHVINNIEKILQNADLILKH